MSKTKKPTKSKASKLNKPKSPKSVAQKGAKSAPPKTSKTTIILFGLDEQEKARAGRFVGEDEALLTRMAKGMGLRMAAPVAAHQMAVANTLPLGDVHSTGLKAVPQIDLALLERLNALAGGETGPISTTQPKTWDDIEPGHLVVVQQSVSEGWWPSIVRRRHQDKLVLVWRDHPGEGEFIRDVNSVALLKTE